MALIWTESAITDLDHIRRYVTAVNRLAATRLARRIATIADTLDAAMPGEDGEVAEIVVADPFLLRYRAGDTAVVMGVRHRRVIT